MTAVLLPCPAYHYPGEVCDVCDCTGFVPASPEDEAEAYEEFMRARDGAWATDIEGLSP